MNSTLVPGSQTPIAGAVRTAVITSLCCLGLTLCLPISARGQHGVEFGCTVDNGTPIGAMREVHQREMVGMFGLEDLG